MKTNHLNREVSPIPWRYDVNSDLFYYNKKGHPEYKLLFLYYKNPKVWALIKGGQQIGSNFKSKKQASKHLKDLITK